ncbi:probable aspartic proteinase GIP2 [Impatiens glandulifera]|uniref:probable aspartic proteinase GIP2 n=1 Tax=Impatiens glandulifera TaxID=253017 RepID=UPI001FB0541B|nr:probable aspartic proteinase GIP2 [Impatiens glandulifera]
MESHHVQVLSLLLILCFTSSQTAPSSLILPISKNFPSLQYTTNLSLGTPPNPITVTIDLAGPFLWLSYDQTLSSSLTLHSAHCHSLLCSLAHFSQTKTLCNKNNSCILYPNNNTQGELTLDVLTLHASNGLKPTSIVNIPNFPFLYSSTKTLPIGLVGLGSSQFGLPKQLAGSFNFAPKFAICLPRESREGYGVMFFGDEPYVFSPGIDVSKLLTYIPLVNIVRPKSRSNVTMFRKSYDYYVIIKSIWVNGKNKLHFNSSLLSIDKQGNGGTRFSTIHPYSIMESSIFNSLAKVFIEEGLASNLTLVPPIEPFGVCFGTREANGGIPIIDLVFQDDYSVFWRIFATNSMVQMDNDIVCLGFIDGGVKATTSIVIGGLQLEDNLLQFDLANSRLGFTSSLLLRQTDCSSFDFSSM